MFYNPAKFHACTLKPTIVCLTSLLIASDSFDIRNRPYNIVKVTLQYSEGVCVLQQGTSYSTRMLHTVKIMCIIFYHLTTVHCWQSVAAGVRDCKYCA